MNDNNFVIQADSREHEGKNNHILQYLEQNNIKYFISKLFVGDYTLLHKQDVCVDRKKDLVEVAGNICGKEHERFRNECIRAKENGIKLYVLIEEEHIYSLNGVQYWRSPIYKYGEKRGQPHTQVQGTTLMKAMNTMQEKYGVIFLFAKRENYTKKLLELLGVE